MFYLRMDSPMDAFVLTDVFHAIYSAFWADYTVPYLTDCTGTQAAQPGRSAAMEDAVRSMNRPGPQPDNSEVAKPAICADEHLLCIKADLSW
jgi:hypothetical protein